MKSQETYIELAYENLLGAIYGRRGQVVSAGPASLPALKKSIIKLFLTLSKASARSINGDEKHRDYIAERCLDAVDSIKRSKSKDEVSQRALSFTFELNFLLLGHLPRNWMKGKPDWRSSVHLYKYRTLFYVRTPKQKIDQIIEYAYGLPGEHDGSLFQRLIEVRNKHPNDDLAVLAWIRKHELKIYEKFNCA